MPELGQTNEKRYTYLKLAAVTEALPKIQKLHGYFFRRCLGYNLPVALKIWNIDGTRHLRNQSADLAGDELLPWIAGRAWSTQEATICGIQHPQVTYKFSRVWLQLIVLPQHKTVLLPHAEMERLS